MAREGGIYKRQVERERERRRHVYLTVKDLCQDSPGIALWKTLILKHY